MSGLGGSTTMASRGLLKSLVIASDYEFLPEGVQIFKKTFDQAMKEENTVSPPPSDCSPLQACDNLEHAALPSHFDTLFWPWLHELIIPICND
jgi:hypothetical protein